MFLRLLALFILVPLLELIILLRLAEMTGWLTTLAIVLVTGVIGSALAHRAGLDAIRRLRASMAEGRMPSAEIQDGVMIAFAAAMLLTPGLITDALGFILLVPRGRRMVGNQLRKWIRVDVMTTRQSWSPHSGASHSGASRADDGRTIDATQFGPKASDSG